MKNNYLVCMLLVVIACSGCSKYTNISINYPLEPKVYLPDNVNTIALANRSLTAKEDKTGKIIESVLSGEIEVSDRKASEQCLKGAVDRLDRNSNFNLVIPVENKLFGSGTREIPAPLDWSLVQQMCNSSDTDALLVLEMFDSNSDMFSLPNILSPKPVNNERNFNVLMYWRLYDPSIKKIIDQYECSRQITFHVGENVLGVPPKALYGAAYSGGQEYIERFLPGHFIENRLIFKRGKGADKQSFKMANRHVETNDWEGAADLWEEILKHDNFKNQGRACLNMAVYFEQAGNIDAAIEWARKAYVDYNVKAGRDYEYALRNL